MEKVGIMEIDSKLTKITDLFIKYDGEISTHEYKHRIVKLSNAVKEDFPNWNILGKLFSVDQTKSPIYETDMKLHSFYSIEQHKKSAFGKMLSESCRVIIVRDGKDQYDLTLQIYEPEAGAKSEVYLIHRITHYGIDNSKYYWLLSQ